MGTREDEKSCNEHKNGVVHPNGITKLSWPDRFTVLDLSHRNLSSFEETVEFPPNLRELDLSHNSLVEIPACVLKLSNVKRLDVSFNCIEYFDVTPSFVHSIEELNISKNQLKGPPYWVWTESPKKLAKLDFSCNPRITQSLVDYYFQELLQYRTPVTEVRLFSCELTKHMELLGTFDKAQVLEIGSSDWSRSFANHVDQLPCKGLNKCCDIKRLNLINTQLYSVEQNIDIYKQLIEINISQNYINSLPKEFCNLENLKVCILSGNSLLYLPEDIVKLKQLECLRVDSNRLCMLPENLHELLNLKVLDLYDNCLYEVPEEIQTVAELDLAQNYLDEPQTEEYKERKERLRLNAEQRFDGRKPEPENAEDECSSSTCTLDQDSDLIEYLEHMPTEEPQSQPAQEEEEEDWDSDEYWVPGGCCRVQVSPPVHPAWFYLVKQKMEAGNFCPMDAHVPSVHEKIAIERLRNPKVWVEVDGQFDDLSDDDS